MGSFADYLENSVLNLVFGNTAFVPSGTLHLALSTADPTDDGTGLTEPLAGSGYARAAVDNDKTTWTVSSAGTLNNDIDITWPEATGAGWGTITHLAIMSQPTGTQMLAHGALSVSKAIDDGDTARVSAGNLQISLT